MMNLITKCLVVFTTMFFGWGIMIWTQAVSDMPVVAGIIGVPSAMLAMAFLAIMAVKSKPC